ncbi:CBS domain-containing protein [Pseudonocardia dioxanivorans]|uniref:CBS domain-containing protein n=1 Tax=Pseudonocardia dioxanivorans TaxID=240495 RepID=UPI000CD1E84F|nr:CBS domain-containing protein [Pseudonocardia dioxanivorans]
MSPRAACRLETLGFTHVYDYVPGKIDWLAHDLPSHGTAADTPTIGAHVRREVVTCRPDESLGEVRARVAASAHRFALVTNTGGILLGRLRAHALDHTDPDSPAADLMEPGPSTLRPHEPATEIRAHLADNDLSYAIVTDPDGVLLGTVHPDDLA